MTDQERAELIERCGKSMFVTATAAHVEAGQSRNGGWSEDQLCLLGVEWPPPKGWKAFVVGRRLPGTTLAAFIRLRDAHLPPVPDLLDVIDGEG